MIFTIVSTLIFAFLFFIWTTKAVTDVVIFKVLFGTMLVLDVATVVQGIIFGTMLVWGVATVVQGIIF